MVIKEFDDWAKSVEAFKHAIMKELKIKEILDFFIKVVNRFTKKSIRFIKRFSLSITEERIIWRDEVNFWITFWKNDYCYYFKIIIGNINFILWFDKKQWN